MPNKASALAQVSCLFVDVEVATTVKHKEKKRHRLVSPCCPPITLSFKSVCVFVREVSITAWESESERARAAEPSPPTSQPPYWLTQLSSAIVTKTSIYKRKQVFICTALWREREEGRKRGRDLLMFSPLKAWTWSDPCRAAPHFSHNTQHDNMRGGQTTHTVSLSVCLSLVIVINRKEKVINPFYNDKNKPFQCRSSNFPASFAIFLVFCESLFQVLGRDVGITWVF